MAVLSTAFLQTYAVAGSSPSTQKTLRDRVRATIRDARSFGPATNKQKAWDDAYRALKAATTQSLQKPTIVMARYSPFDVVHGKRGKQLVVILHWLEDQPSLKKVIVRNPDTGREIRVDLPKFWLDEANKYKNMQVLFLGSIHIPADLSEDPTQALEIRAPGQTTPATCYPSVRLTLDKKSRASTTMPSTSQTTEEGDESH